MTTPTGFKSQKKTLLQNSVAGLDLTQAFRVSRAYVQNPEAMPVGTPRSSILEETGSTTNPVHSGQGSDQTVSKTGRVHHGPGSRETVSKSDSVQAEQSPGQTESKTNPVQNELGSKSTGFKTDPVTKVRNTAGQEGRPAQKNRLPLLYRQQSLRAKDHYTAVPNYLLREANSFEDPNDFMVYLRMFSLAFGYGRNTCDMGLTELINFTRLGKNAVKRAIDRLVQQGWIKVVGDFEPGQIARKWRVFLPWEKGLCSEPTYVLADGTGAAVDPVQNRPSPKSTERGSIADPVTGSKTDPYKAKEKKTEKNSFSLSSEVLKTYFDELKPLRKRESEWQAFQEIRNDFSEQDIAEAFEQITKAGLPNGEPCHSPMAYLATAMADVLAVVRTQQERDRKRAENAAALEAERLRAVEHEARERAEWERREAAFNRAFPSEEDQQGVIEKLCREGKCFATKGIMARTFAVGTWFDQQHGLDVRKEATA